MRLSMGLSSSSPSSYAQRSTAESVLLQLVGEPADMTHERSWACEISESGTSPRVGSTSLSMTCE